LSYTNELFNRKVEFDLNAFVQMPQLVWFLWGKPLQTEAVARVSEPAEFMRTIDLARSYAAELKRRFIDKDQADDAFAEFMQKKEPDSFRYHDDAADYLRKQVKGVKTSLETSYGTRIIDAMDGQDIVHQAYLTFTESQIREQMVKDVELLRKGDPVKGVVWHFFKRTGQTKAVGPSAQLRQELEDNGIVVVVHD